ncbi:hypothetical protein FACS1894202_01860 [Clostridia bacterium]|nr:hypothetical protein FACS1894202_01860 [Clostridia bacterium]
MAINGGVYVAKIVDYDGGEWLVFDERDGKVLLITKNIIEKRPYNADRFCAAWGRQLASRVFG